MLHIFAYFELYFTSKVYLCYFNVYSIYIYIDLLCFIIQKYMHTNRQNRHEKSLVRK